MNIRQLLISGWDWEPSVLIGCAGLIALYFAWIRRESMGTTSAKNMAYFLSAIAILLLALVSPIDTLADDYLFSAHMLQHLLLMLAVPPLLILGIPETFAIRIMRRRFVTRSEFTLSKPVVAWIAGVGTVAVWHLPLLYNAALANEEIHIIQHLCFLVSATIFWWPLLAPIPSLRLDPPRAIMYLFLAIISSTVIAAIITFAPVLLYPAYLAPKDDLGLLTTIRQGWGISPLLDQQLGGLLMWVPGCAVYLWAILSVVLHWLGPPAKGEPVEFPIAQFSSAAASGRSEIA